MSPKLNAYLFASALMIGSAPYIFALPAQAQVYADVSFDAFHDQLSNYGDWDYSDRWGEVWRPIVQDQSSDWRPYSYGHWVLTEEYGWTWVSDEGPWADIAYHYGRWVDDPDDGWLWLPGYVWSPAWVVWRGAGENVGWMPMPPDEAFLGVGASISFEIGSGGWDDLGGYYGYARWYGPRYDRARFDGLWTFVPSEHMADPGYRNYAVPRQQIVNIVNNSRNVTNYTVVNNVIVNRSVTNIQNNMGRPVAPVAAASVLRTTRWIAPVNRGEQIKAQMQQTQPRGHGTVNSAPPPSPMQVRTLSVNPKHTAPVNNQPSHLLNQANVQQLQARTPGGNNERNGQRPEPPTPGPATTAAPSPLTPNRPEERAPNRERPPSVSERAPEPQQLPPQERAPNRERPPPVAERAPEPQQLQPQERALSRERPPPVAERAPEPPRQPPPQERAPSRERPPSVAVREPPRQPPPRQPEARNPPPREAPSKEKRPE